MSIIPRPSPHERLRIFNSPCLRRGNQTSPFDHIFAGVQKFCQEGSKKKGRENPFIALMLDSQKSLLASLAELSIVINNVIPDSQNIIDWQKNGWPSQDAYEQTVEPVIWNLWRPQRSSTGENLSNYTWPQVTTLAKSQIYSALRSPEEAQNILQDSAAYLEQALRFLSGADQIVVSQQIYDLSHPDFDRNEMATQAIMNSKNDPLIHLILSLLQNDVIQLTSFKNPDTQTRFALLGSQGAIQARFIHNTLAYMLDGTTQGNNSSPRSLLAVGMKPTVFFNAQLTNSLKKEPHESADMILPLPVEIPVPNYQGKAVYVLGITKTLIDYTLQQYALQLIPKYI